MTQPETDQGIVLTDPDGRPKPTSTRCPDCGAPKSARRVAKTFGGTAVHCGECAHRFPTETTT